MLGLSNAKLAALASPLPARPKAGRPWLWPQRAVLDGILLLRISYDCCRRPNLRLDLAASSRRALPQRCALEDPVGKSVTASWGWCLEHLIVGKPGERLVDLPHALELAPHVVEALGAVLIDLVQAPAASRAGAGIGIDHALARKVGRQVTPSRPGPHGLPRLDNARRAVQAIGLVDLEHSRWPVRVIRGPSRTSETSGRTAAASPERARRATSRLGYWRRRPRASNRRSNDQRRHRCREAMQDEELFQRLTFPRATTISPEHGRSHPGSLPSTATDRRLVGAQRGTSVDPLRQHGELERRQCSSSTGGRASDKKPLLEVLGKQAQTLAIPP